MWLAGLEGRIHQSRNFVGNDKGLKNTGSNFDLYLLLSRNANLICMSTIVAPSLLAANFARLHEAMDLINRSEANWLHLDVMDGHFVPNISFGIPVIEAIRPLSTKPFDVHLMISEPDRYLEAFRAAGADRLTVHLEACQHLDRTLAEIRRLGMANGVALNPHTPVAGLRHLLPSIDLVLIMSVNPGFGGQKFIPYSLQKVAELRQMIDEAGCGTLIEIDGGVNAETGRALVAAGADVLVAGSYVFGHARPEEAISGLAALQRGTEPRFT